MQAFFINSFIFGVTYYPIHSPTTSSPVIADTGSATTEHIPLHIFNHKVLTFIASYLADFNVLGGFPEACDKSVS